MWFFVQLCSSWRHFNWLRASRGPSVIAELLVSFAVMQRVARLVSDSWSLYWILVSDDAFHVYVALTFTVLWTQPGLCVITTGTQPCVNHSVVCSSDWTTMIHLNVYCLSRLQTHSAGRLRYWHLRIELAWYVWCVSVPCTRKAIVDVTTDGRSYALNAAFMTRV